MSPGREPVKMQVVVAEDKKSASLCLAAELPLAELTQESCLKIITAQGVQVTAFTREAIAKLLESCLPPVSEPAQTTPEESTDQIPANAPAEDAPGVAEAATDAAPEGEPPTLGKQVNWEIAVATPLQQGIDGKVIWENLKQGNDPKSSGNAAEQAQSETTATSRANAARVSHYDRSSFMVVKNGQLLGKVVPPVPEVHGVDVLGKVELAKPGKPVQLNLDETVSCDAQGNIVAKMDGVLIRTDLSLTIRTVIEVKDYVDFSTGHIDFDGDVVIQKGIRDCFIVKATGDVTVKGLIEAATVICGGSLDAAGGFAGREQGKASIGGDLIGRYLDNLSAEVKGDLKIAREIINSELTIHGNVLCSGCAVMSGSLTVGGTMEMAIVGSPAGVRTEIILDKVPALDQLASKMTTLMSQMTKQHDALVATYKELEAYTGRLSPAQRKKQDETHLELVKVRMQRINTQKVLDALNQRIDDKRTLDLKVSRMISAGVCMTIHNQQYVLNSDLPGPVHIYRDEQGQVVYKQGQAAAAPLGQVARVRTL